MNSQMQGLTAQTRGLQLPRASEKAEQRKNRSAIKTHIATKLFLLSMVGSVVYGWWIREEDYLSAEEGLGYWLGVVGGSMLLYQVLYPLRKKLHFMRNWGSMASWFSLHQILGLLGPVIILYHANFRLHAVNSNVALFAMILVVISGLIGRFIYMRVNYSLHGQKMTLEALQQELDATRAGVDLEELLGPRIRQLLKEYERKQLRPAEGILQDGRRFLALGIDRRFTRYGVNRELGRELMIQAEESGWDTETLRRRAKRDRALIAEYLNAVSRIVQFSAYRRLFSLWHVLHMPLFIMMMVTGVVHVVAVHMY